MSPLEPPPLAGVASSTALGVAKLSKFLGRGWIETLPSWCVPIAWGISIGTPVAVILAWFMEGRPPQWITYIGLTAMLSAGMLASLTFHTISTSGDRRQARRRAALDERRQNFRDILLKELKETPVSRFDYPDLIADVGIPVIEAEIVADEVYAMVARRVVDDGVITTQERSKLDSLATLLKVGKHRADQIEGLAKNERYENAYAEAAADGIFTQEEVQELSKLRRSLGLKNEIVPSASFDYLN